MKVVVDPVSEVDAPCMCCDAASRGFLDACEHPESPLVHDGYLGRGKHRVMRVHQYECGHVMCEDCARNGCPVCSRGPDRKPQKARRW